MTLLHLTSHLNGFYLLNPRSSKLSSLSQISFSVSHRTQFQSLVVSAKRKKKRVGYRRFTRILFNSLSLLSPNVHILQQPLDLVIADLGGVDGGGGGGRGLGFRRGWGRFDGWSRKRNGAPILLFVCVIIWIYGFCKASGKEIKNESFLKVLGICLFNVTRLKRNAIILVFGLPCFVASLVFWI